MFRALGLFAILFLANSVSAHQKWSNEEPVPEWVAKSCCGVADAHHLREDQVHVAPDGYHVDGLSVVIPFAKALPSPDGSYWGFWSPLMSDPTVYCFFASVGGT